MSMISSTASASAGSSLNSVFYHPNRRSLNSAIDQPGNGSSEGPASTTNLFGMLLQSTLQVAGLPVMSAAAASAGISGTAAAASAARSGAATGSTATGTTAPHAPAQQVQSFVYSLFQALKADGLGGAGQGAATATAGTTLASGGAAGQYAGSLASSLQTLIGQLGSGAAVPAPVANLSAAFNDLVGAARGSTGSGGATPASNAALRNFLGNVLQSVQGGGSISLAVGANVNARV